MSEVTHGRGVRAAEETGRGVQGNLAHKKLSYFGWTHDHLISVGHTAGAYALPKKPDEVYAAEWVE